MFGLGAAEVAVIVVVAVVLLGPARLPPLLRAAGAGYREFLRVRRRVEATIDELKRDIDLGLDRPEVKPAEHTRHVPLDQLHAMPPPTKPEPAPEPTQELGDG